MSTAIETEAEASPAEETTGRPDWITLAEAVRITGRHHSTLCRMALAGALAVRAIPGARTLYRRADCERIGLAAAD